MQEELVRQAIAVRILRDIDLAEDAVQAAMITAWTELRALRQGRLRAHRGYLRKAPPSA